MDTVTVYFKEKGLNIPNGKGGVTFVSDPDAGRFHWTRQFEEVGSLGDEDYVPAHTEDFAPGGIKLDETIAYIEASQPKPFLLKTPDGKTREVE